MSFWPDTNIPKSQNNAFNWRGAKPSAAVLNKFDRANNTKLMKGTQPLGKAITVGASKKEAAK